MTISHVSNNSMREVPRSIPPTPQKSAGNYHFLERLDEVLMRSLIRSNVLENKSVRAITYARAEQDENARHWRLLPKKLNRRRLTENFSMSTIAHVFLKIHPFSWRVRRTSPCKQAVTIETTTTKKFITF